MHAIRLAFVGLLIVLIAQSVNVSRAQERGNIGASGEQLVFGRNSMAYPTPSLVPQWSRILSHKSGSNYKRALTPLIRDLDGLSLFDKLNTVNTRINSLEYGSDIEFYDEVEYWANPAEFLGRGGGDCEDFAIAKFFALRALGIPNETLRIVGVSDVLDGSLHAVMTVKFGEKILVLDNRSDQIFEDTQYTFYSPIFAVNETALWSYVEPGQLAYNLTSPRDAGNSLATLISFDWSDLLGSYLAAEIPSIPASISNDSR